MKINHSKPKKVEFRELRAGAVFVGHAGVYMRCEDAIRIEKVEEKVSTLSERVNAVNLTTGSHEYFAAGALVNCAPNAALDLYPEISREDYK